MKIRTKAFCAVRQSPLEGDWLEIGTISVHPTEVSAKVDKREPAFNAGWPVVAIIPVTVEGDMP